MYKTYKVMLIPNDKQRSRFFELAGASRFAYNWALAKQQENHEQGNKFISAFTLTKEFTEFKKQEGNEWLYVIPSSVTAIAITDCCEAFIKFFKGQNKFPKFKSKRKSKPSFANKYNKISISETHVRLEKLSLSNKGNKRKFNQVRLAEKGRIPTGEGVTYANPRITFDGLNWWFSVGVETEMDYSPPQREGVGIDLGISALAVTSDGDVFENINKTETVRKLEKKKKRLQRQVSRKYEMNKDGQKFVKTQNIKKLEREILVLTQRLANIRQQHIHEITTELVNRKPQFIAVEDLNVSGMMKNKHLAKAVMNQKFYEFRRVLEYKCKWHNIEFIVVNRFFPSSKTCCQCGEVKVELKLSERVFKCECGNEIDRDYQAAINIKRYAEREIASRVAEQ